MQLGLVGELARVAAQEVELDHGGEGEELAGVGEVEVALEPARVEQQVLEEEGEALGDRVVAQVAVLERKLAPGVREVFGVAALVQQGSVVVLPALGHDHQVDLVGHVDRGAEGPRRLAVAGRGVDDGCWPDPSG